MKIKDFAKKTEISVNPKQTPYHTRSVMYAEIYFLGIIFSMPPM